MHCFVEELPSEIVVLVLQEVDGETIDALIEAMPRLLESALVREYVGSRRTECVEHCCHGLIATGNHRAWMWPVIKSMKVVSSCMCSGSKRHRVNNFVHLEVLQNMKRLQQLHVEHGDAKMITKLLKCLPESLEIFEVVVTKAARGKPNNKATIESTSFESLNISTRSNTGADTGENAALNTTHSIVTVAATRKTKPSLRMITIINVNRWNRRKVLQSVGASISVVKQDNGEWQRTWPKMKTPATSILFQLGAALGELVASNSSTLQNVGVFGIDAVWIMREAVLNDTYYNKLRMVRVGGESLARSPLWTKYFEGERREFAYGVYMRPLVVVFSPMFKDRCKVIACSNRSNAAFVGGTGVDFLRNYTFI